ncbi:MAG: ferritin [Rhodothermaceae bacterium]|nr:ferritin [Bacteroidota bacterium]MXW15695.1 ferritin [Rhodothermaceae bacterium]MCY3594240.1 ferritin [Bacteroidota bacterium]MCY3629845.1 ferritin [Bacteroidota bacterium]MDE2646395.1 ferritin [Bacteroidota bacterium]
MARKGLSKRMQIALNEQIKAELDSAYLYLALAAEMESRNLKGFAHWLRIQWEEELVHGLKLYDFLLQRDARVELHALDKPSIDSEQTTLEIFSQVLEHEQYITARINQLYALAQEDLDYGSQTLLHWFIEEQLEEEESAREIVDNLRLVGESGAALFLLDRELGQRSDDHEEE